MTQKYLNKRFRNQANCDSFTNFRKSENSKKSLFRAIIYSHFPNFFKFLFGSIFKRFKNNDLWRLERVHTHYYFYKIVADYKLATNEEFRKYAVKYDYMND